MSEINLDSPEKLAMKDLSEALEKLRQEIQRMPEHERPLIIVIPGTNRAFFNLQ